MKNPSQNLKNWWLVFELSDFQSTIRNLLTNVYFQKGTGLLNMLPEPRSGEIIKRPATNFVPHVLTKPPPPKIVKPVKPPPKKSTLVDSYNSSDDSDVSGDETEVDFFSLNKNEVVEEIPVESNYTDLKDDESQFKCSEEIKGYRSQIMSHQNIDFDPRAYEDPDDFVHEILPDPEDDTNPQSNMDDEAVSFSICALKFNVKNYLICFYFFRILDAKVM